MSLYERLKYAKKESDGLYNWLGNLRWYVTENESGRFSFRCISALKDMTHEECVAINTTKELFAINLLEKESDEWIYGVDYLQTQHIKIMLPFHEYGAYICAETDMQICFEGNSYDKDGICVIQNGAYYICLCLKKLTVM